MLPEHFEAMRERLAYDNGTEEWVYVGLDPKVRVAECLAAMDVMWGALVRSKNTAGAWAPRRHVEDSMAKVEAMGDGKT